MRNDGTATREEQLAKVTAKQTLREKWRPKRELWPGDITDDLTELFGKLNIGDEVDVLVESSKYPEITSAREWTPGAVVAMDDRRRRVAVCLSNYGTFDVKTGQGNIRRPEDARELCSAEVQKQVARYRKRDEAEALMQYALTLSTVPSRSHALMALCRMDRVFWAERLITEHGFCVNSVALRELAHFLARRGIVSRAIDHARVLPDVMAAQLIVEVLALALTSRIQAEKQRLDVPYLQGVESNPAVREIVEAVNESLPLLEGYQRAVQMQDPLVSREGFTEAFNELLQSCGRAFAVPVSFRVLMWMEALNVPKNAFTYEAIGLNVVKRVGLLRKVWDLPNAPEESVPEVVFAGRSNVGKSSLVNMLLGRLALAPTSSKPGKTRTIDFFDVNAGHPALPRFRLVDVPGLGYARASKDMRQRWLDLIGGYFIQRKPLKIVFHLLDAGLCEILPADRILWKLLAQARRTDFELCIALTKADRSLPAQMERFARIVREALRREGSELAMHATIFACSSHTKLGKDTLWRKIWSAVSDVQNDEAQGAPSVQRVEEYTPALETEREEAQTSEAQSGTTSPAPRPRILDVLL